MRFGLVLLFVLAVSACGVSVSTESGSAPAETADINENSEVCPDASHGAPALLPVGEVQELPETSKNHVLCASYDHTPPASGDHFPVWQNCGIYTEPIQNQTAVHSLEHGAVWVAYQPDLDPAVVQTMTDQLQSANFALMAPYPGLQNPIVLTAWTRQLAVDNWTDPAVQEFLDTYLGRYSPVAPEAGASCGQAVGTPPNEPNANYQEILQRVI